MVVSKIFFMFKPYLGKYVHFDEHIFSTGLVQPPGRISFEHIFSNIEEMRVLEMISFHVDFLGCKIPYSTVITFAMPCLY